MYIFSLGWQQALKRRVWLSNFSNSVDALELCGDTAEFLGHFCYRFGTVSINPTLAPAISLAVIRWHLSCRHSAGFLPKFCMRHGPVGDGANVGLIKLPLGLQFKGTVQRVLNFVFLTYIDRARPEYEPLLLLKFFRGPTILDQRTFSSRGSGEILSEKLNFLENFYK
jgi:hypothetical protein